jgi:hypothetical protein
MSASKADVMIRLGLTGSTGERIYKRMLVSIILIAVQRLY